MRDFLTLSVQDFFTVCNWNNAPPKNIKSEVIININSLAVDNFFNLVNWSGIETQKLTKSPENVIKNVGILSVKEFFSLGNWTGKSLVNETVNLTPELKLTFSVKDFFSQFNWTNSGKLDKIPETKDNLNLAITPDFQLSLDDLSDLF